MGPWGPMMPVRPEQATTGPWRPRDEHCEDLCCDDTDTCRCDCGWCDCRYADRQGS